jgi:UPF0716 protein FxsA
MRRAFRFVPLVLLCAAVVEVTVAVLVARRVGVPVTVVLVLAASAAGVLLLRREGARAWRGFRDAARSGQRPGAQVTDGVVGLAAGVLLAAPGLVSGASGLLLVVPPVRSVARRLVRTVAERRLSSATAGDLFGPRRVRARRGPASASASGDPVVHGEVVDGEVLDARRG